MQAGFLGHLGDDGGFKVLLSGIPDEGLGIPGRHGHSHPFLTFGDGDFRAIKPLVLQRNPVQVYLEAVRELSHGHCHAARSEIVAALDEAAGVLTAEETLQLALLRGVALLHLGSALVEALGVLRLRSACCSTYPVAPGPTADQDDQVAGGWFLTDDMVGGGGRHDCADLHALGLVSGMIELVDLPGGQTDLVSVGRIPVGR